MLSAGLPARCRPFSTHWPVLPSLPLSPLSLPSSNPPPLQEVFQFLLSPEARDLRPLLVAQLVAGLDLLLRDRVRKLVTITLPSLTPRLPFLGECHVGEEEGDSAPGPQAQPRLHYAAPPPHTH